jgi:hypothetical protein
LPSWLCGAGNDSAQGVRSGATTAQARCASAPAC